jgi:plastocyanin
MPASAPMHAAFLLAMAALPALAAVPVAAATHTVVIDKMKFGALPAKLRVGDTIIWVNNDMFRHTATAKDGSFNVDLPPNTSGKVVLGKPGKVAFVCKYHPGMKGELTVAGR